MTKLNKLPLFVIIFSLFFISMGYSQVDTVDTRLVYVSNTYNSPSPGQGTLIIDVEAISLGTPFIRVFQDAFRLDETLRNQNPIVTFSDELFPDDELFPGSGPMYNTTEDYQPDGDVIYVYSYNVGTPGSIGMNWTQVVRVTIEYTMTGGSSTISWSMDLPNFFVSDFSLNNITGTEMPIPLELTDVPLPVKLASFSAEVADRAVELKWVTESEIENAGFEVWRSQEEKADYSLLSSYQYNEALHGQGNSSTRHEYTYRDEMVVQGQRYWYKLVDVAMNGERGEHGPVSIEVLLSDGQLTSVSSDIPSDFKLHQNYPNPFNPSTRIRFDIPQVKEGQSKVSLVIYNALGQVVRRLYSGEIGAGGFEVEWDGRSDVGNPIPSGMYFAVFAAKDYYQTIRLVLLK